MANLSSSIISAGNSGAHNFEPYRVYDFELNILELPGADVLKLSVEVGALPNISSDEIELGYGNDYIYLQGKTRVDPLSFTFRDFADPETTNVLMAWHALHYDPNTGVQGLASDYKKSALLVKYLPDGSIEQSWVVGGLWIQSANFGSLDNNSTDIIRIEVSFRFDRAFAPNQLGG